ncbi:MAG: hypothetical protein ACOX8H_08350 [Ruminococcus sp.]|jgi:hypothetical protein
MRKLWKWIAVLLGVRQIILADTTVWGGQASEVITEITITEEYWTEEFTGTEEETKEWEEQRKEREQEEESSKEEEVQHEGEEEIIEIVEEPADEGEAEPHASEKNAYTPETDENDVRLSDEPELIRDETPPVIQTVNLSAFTASSLPVAPEIIISDENIVRENIHVSLRKGEGEDVPFAAVYEQKENQVLCRMDSIEEEGRYLLSVKAEDKERNISEVSWIFTVNRTGTRFAYDEEKKYVKREDNFSPRIRIDNYDGVKVLSCMVNENEAEYWWEGEEVVIASEAISGGRNVITIVTKDGAGNLSSMTPWEIICKE